MDLAGKTVIVTGVASGIGKETGAELVRRGARVIGVDRCDAPDLDETYICDLSDRAEIDDLVEALPGGADGLCNIAGVAPTRHGALVLTVNFLALRHLTTRLVGHEVLPSPEI